MSILDGQKIVLLTDLFLDRSNVLQRKFDNLSALFAVEVSVGVSTAGFFVKTVPVSEVDRLQFTALHEKLKGPVDRGAGDAFFVPPDFVEKLLRLEMIVLVEDDLRYFFPLLRKTKAFLIQKFPKTLERFPCLRVPHGQSTSIF
jgi:hypothetical protein